MLVLIGLGLNDESDITLKGLEEARSCDSLYAEFYTSPLAGLDVRGLKVVMGREITVLKRKDLEEGSDELVEEAKDRKVGLLVPGDPLISTTHLHLMIEAKRAGIETKVVHNASIYSAAPSISGLQNYKFGKSASIAEPEENFYPLAPYETLKENLEHGLHTLLYLDVGEKPMPANRALEILLKMEEREGENVVGEDTLVVVLGRAGDFDHVLRAGAIKELIKEDFGPVPHCLIVPGELHFVEEEYLKEFAGLQ